MSQQESIKQFDSQISPANDTKDDTNVHKELTERQRVVLKMIQADVTITSQKIAQEMSQEMSQEVTINERTIKRDLAKMRELGVLRHVGSTKGGHWEIVGKDKK